ncbi:uncharacterized protein LY89DRAFT_733658 [Mollisia scopiformis]|uniref:Uncharacterized protein n=1 Tax=Mollisia scopiformis TaxID=149040 RepID=A0A194XDK9_MOLSC|nr:uncharacterized protein LY89DRAFT_733658 [Mollisia scopiformis]KUJ17837.1 hypothetical protein LY89DRAFT_733658 [Mollisia scopiformis]
MPPKRKISSTITAARKRARIDTDQLWTPTDKYLESKVIPAEWTARNRAHRYFKCAPEDLLPEDTYIDTSGNGTTTWDDMRIPNTNWTASLATAFSATLSCTTFHRQPELLRLAIQRAMYLRLGKEKIRRPDRANLRQFQHYKFVHHLIDVIYNKSKPRGGFVPDGVGLVARDLDCINEAWDEYVKSSSDQSLRTIKAYQKQASLSKSKADLPKKSELRDERKELVLRHRELESRYRARQDQDLSEEDTSSDESSEEEEEQEVEAQEESEDDPFRDDESFGGFPDSPAPSPEPQPQPVDVPEMEVWPQTPLEPLPVDEPSVFYIEHRRHTSRPDLNLRLEDKENFDMDEDQEYVRGASPIGRESWVESGLILPRDLERWHSHR